MLRAPSINSYCRSVKGYSAEGHEDRLPEDVAGRSLRVKSVFRPLRTPL
jgi:hypothetical protein